MKKVFNIQSPFFLLFFSFFLLTSFSPSEKVKWKKYSSTKYQFKVKFPAAVDESISEEDGITTLKLNSKINKNAFLFYCTEHTTPLANIDSKSLAEEALKGFSSALGAKKIDSSDWSYKGHAGKQASFSNNEIRVDYRVVIIGQNQYQAMVTSRKTDFKNDLAQKFFKSIKIKK